MSDEPTTDLFTETRRLGRLKRRERILSRRKKEATERRVAQERFVHELMVQHGLRPEANDGIKLDGVNFSPQETYFATVQDKAALVEWLLAEGDESIVEEKLKQDALNQLVREFIDNNQPLPPGLGYWQKTWVSTKAVPGKSATATQGDDDEQDG